MVLDFFSKLFARINYSATFVVEIRVQRKFATSKNDLYKS
jgi:hypothetical protein